MGWGGIGWGGMGLGWGGVAWQGMGCTASARDGVSLNPTHLTLITYHNTHRPDGVHPEALQNTEPGDPFRLNESGDCPLDVS